MTDETAARAQAEKDSAADLEKPLEQLLADVHEELKDGQRQATENIAHAFKRVTSAFVATAISNQKAADKISDMTAISTLAAIAAAISSIASCIRSS